MRFKIDIDKSDITFENSEVIVVDFSHKRTGPSYRISQTGEGVRIWLLRGERHSGRVVQVEMVDHYLFSGNVYKFVCSDKNSLNVPLFLITGEINIWESI